MMKTMMFLAAVATMAFAAQGFAETTTTAATDTSMQHMTDQQIAGIMKEANDAEISAAKMAKSKATSSDVKSFAGHMIKEHTMNNKMAMTVEKRADINPVASADSHAIQKDASTKGTELKKTSKTNFDRTYIDQQVAMHSQLLKDLDATYIPQTQSAEMKAFLEQTRMHVQKHLEMAQKIQAKLEGKGQTEETTKQ